MIKSLQHQQKNNDTMENSLTKKQWNLSMT